MSGSDLSKLHLKKRELTQIKKASRVLRDPGTSSSWRSPLPSSSRSLAPPAAVVEPRKLPIRAEERSRNNSLLLESSNQNRKEKKKVFLHNWKTHKSSSDISGLAHNEQDDESSWTHQASDDDVSDARNGADSMILRKKKKDIRHGTLMKLKNKNWSPSLRTSRQQQEGSHNSTPSSYNMYAVRTDGGTTTCDGDDELGDDDLPGCGIWTKKARGGGGCRSCCSPSLSDTLRNSILCGGTRRLNRHSYGGGYSKHKIDVLPLLTYGTSIGTGLSDGDDDDDDDEISTNYGEIDLEAQSRLDGRRWSTSCRSQESTPENISSFSQKYRPMFFDELIGQSIVVQSLINAVKRSKISPVYLFQGPRGTGKTSTAKIFSAALNCVATEEMMKPCGYCKECNEFMSGKSKDYWEVDGGSKKGADKVRYLLRNLPMILPRKTSSTYKAFVIDECHLLPSKTWLSFLKFLDNPLKKVVFIFITTDLDNVPRTIQSRCQKFLFDKVKDGDIVVRLKKIASEENLDVEAHALDLIAMNADGSLRDAETMLEQLSLLGKRITTGLVNELVGVVSDEKLLELLELALSSDTAETVKRARELLDLGADPIVLMSQLASLIMDIIAGTYKVVDEKYSEAFLDGRNLSKADMEGLKHALKLLSEAEKQLRVSNDRSTWFTATLLQLGSMPSPVTTCSSRRQSSRATDDDLSSISREVIPYKQRTGGAHFSKSASPKRTHEAKSFSRVIDNTCYKPSSSSQTPESEASIASHYTSTMTLTQRSSEKVNEIWRKCVERCHSKTLRQLLYTHGKLISISEVEGILVAYIAFGETDLKLRAERFISSITNSMETVLRRNVEVRILLLPETEKQETTNKGGDHKSDLGVGSSEEGNRSKLPMQRIESIIREQRLETAWLQTADKDTPGSLTRIRPERNQILPQEDTLNLGAAAVSPCGLTSHRWGDELNSDVKLLRIGQNGELQENLTGRRGEHCTLSPSLLHDSKFGHNKDNLGGYESGTGRVGCSMLLCWNTHKTQRSNKSKQGKGTPVGPRRSRKRGFSLFNGCAKPRKPAGNLRR